MAYNDKFELIKSNTYKDIYIYIYIYIYSMNN